MDAFGLLPAGIRANYEREEMVNRQFRSADALVVALRALDPTLELVFISDRLEEDNPYGVKPGRWHVKRPNQQDGPDLYAPITKKDGSYREPDFGVLEELRSRDLWQRGAVERQQAASRPKQEHDEDRVEEIASDIRAAKRVSGEGGLEKRLWGKK